jgi:hypothetical protein
MRGRGIIARAVTRRQDAPTIQSTPTATRVAKTKQPFNPFYALVVLTGAAFAVTTFAYGTMAYRASDPAVAVADQGPGLMSLVDRYGVQTMGVELGLLGAATFGAMWLDRLRLRKAGPNDWPENPLDEPQT